MRFDELDLPCGCKTWKEFVRGTPTFFMQACILGTECEYVKYAMEESERQGKPPEVREQ